VGGFFNVSRPTTGPYGGDQSRLRPATVPGLPDGTVWEGFRRDWVWESGVEYPVQPVRVSGVYVGGAFVPVQSGVVVDYPNGRVVLPSAVPATSVVQCEFSPRLYQLYSADHPAWRQIQTGSWRADDPQFLQAGSGAWDTLSENRVQLPAVFIEAVPDAHRIGIAVGGGCVVRQSVLFHVVAEERTHMKWAHDAFVAQKEKRIQGFDKDLLLAADAFPLTESGVPKNTALMYPALVQPTGQGGFYWEQIRFIETRGVPQPRLGNLWFCSVRATMELDRPG
jgi:hypothetical protein